MKKMKFLAAGVLFVFTSVCASCSLFEYDLTEAFHRDNKVEKRAQKLKIIDDNEQINSIASDEEYDVLVVADFHFGCENLKGNGPRCENKWFNSITETDSSGKRIVDNVRFVICLGDVADHGIEKEFKRYDETVTKKLLEIKTPKAPDGIQILNIVGNHDLYNSGWKVWSKYCYPHTSFYKVETPSFGWYFIDTASGTMGSFQYDELKWDMENSSKKKMVFSHVPIYAGDYYYFVMQNTQERNKLISTCAKNNTVFFVDGHTHDECTSDLGKFVEKTMPGFLFRRGYAILHVNEKDADVSIEVKYF